MTVLKVKIFFYVLTLTTTAVAQQAKQKDYLIQVEKRIRSKTYGYLDVYGYSDQKGRLVIRYGKYPMIYTDTFRTYAIVLKSKEGLVAIDRNEKVLYHIFPFENGPDDVVEGLFRIVKNGKIGFADTNGKVVIAPQFECAYPFENGKAKVSNNCTEHKQGEHKYWESADWFYIDKEGKKL
jgi:hypothetical protein